MKKLLLLAFLFRLGFDLRSHHKGKCEAFKQKGERKFAITPDLQDYIPIDDRREQWEEEAKKDPSTKDERQAFYKQRISLVNSCEGSSRTDELLQDLKESVEREELVRDDDEGDNAPIPGGVGYGAYYKDEALAFNQSSMLRYNIVVIPAIGNSQNQWLYLTSTNRAPKGVEAYVSYRQQDRPKFKVFDWSKVGDARFALSRPYDLLADYLGPHQAGGYQYQTLYVSNSTRRLVAGGDRWINEVMLLNRQTGNYDLVYSNEYELAQTDEDNYKWWGPIVETFPPFPFTINDVGFFEAQLLQDDKPPKMLTSDVTNLRTDHPGFQVVLRDPNHSFVVHW
jgi:hypothetical protein